MKVDAIVRQLSTRGGAFINILQKLEGGIGVWGSNYGCPTFLLLIDATWLLVTFEDRAWVDDELPGLIDSWKPDRVLVLPTMEEWREHGEDES